MPHFTTRLGTSEDHGAIAELVNLAFAEDRFGDPPHLETDQSICDQTTFGMAVFIVAIATDGRLVGCVQVNRGGRISFLLVHPAMRRQGLGRQLTAAAEDYARKDGCESVSVSVFTEQVDLLRRYRG